MTKKNGEKLPKSNAARQAAYRARKKESQLNEVRGIYATQEDHEKIKNYALMLMSMLDQ